MNLFIVGPPSQTTKRDSHLIKPINGVANGTANGVANGSANGVSNGGFTHEEIVRD